MELAAFQSDRNRPKR